MLFNINTDIIKSNALKMSFPTWNKVAPISSERKMFKFFWVIDSFELLLRVRVPNKDDAATTCQDVKMETKGA